MRMKIWFLSVCSIQSQFEALVTFGVGGNGFTRSAKCARSSLLGLSMSFNGMSLSKTMCGGQGLRERLQLSTALLGRKAEGRGGERVR